MLLVRKRLQLLLSRCRRFCVPTLLLGLGMALYVQLPAVATSKWCAETKVDCYFMTRFRQSATGKNHVDYMAIYREIDRWRISPDGKTLHALVTTAERRGSLHILDTADGSLRNIFFRDVELERLGTICRSSDFRHVAVCLDDRQIAFADTLSGREWKTALPSHQAVGPEAKRRIRPVWQQPMGDFFVFTDELEYQCQLHVLAARSGELLATLPADILGAEPLTTKDDLLIYTAAVANQERDGAASSAVTGT